MVFSANKKILLLKRQAHTTQATQLLSQRLDGRCHLVGFFLEIFAIPDGTGIAVGSNLVGRLRSPIGHLPLIVIK